jgi:hypothetical protein
MLSSALLPAAELLSFLKQTHGAWTERDFSKALNISSAEAEQAIAAMQLQGYPEPIARTQKWRTTSMSSPAVANLITEKKAGSVHRRHSNPYCMWTL